MKPDLILQKIMGLNLSSVIGTTRSARAMTRSRLPSSPAKQVMLASVVCALTVTLGHDDPLDPEIRKRDSLMECFEDLAFNFISPTFATGAAGLSKMAENRLLSLKGLHQTQSLSSSPC
jgi:hypothetical protein